MAGIAYWILQQAIIRSHGRDSLLAKAIGTDIKGYGSIVLYAIAIPLAFYQEWIADAIYVTNSNRILFTKGRTHYYFKVKKINHQD